MPRRDTRLSRRIDRQGTSPVGQGSGKGSGRGGGRGRGRRVGGQRAAGPSGVRGPELWS